LRLRGESGDAIDEGYINTDPAKQKDGESFTSNYIRTHNSVPNGPESSLKKPKTGSDMLTGYMQMHNPVSKDTKWRPADFKDGYVDMTHPNQPLSKAQGYVKMEASRENSAGGLLPTHGTHGLDSHPGQANNATPQGYHGNDRGHAHGTTSRADTAGGKEKPKTSCLGTRPSSSGVVSVGSADSVRNDNGVSIGDRDRGRGMGKHVCVSVLRGVDDDEDQNTSTCLYTDINLRPES
ncbi:hypothetical protein SARC_15881, partial [Sphaeroforma arctica JP610]